MSRAQRSQFCGHKQIDSTGDTESCPTSRSLSDISFSEEVGDICLHGFKNRRSALCSSVPETSMPDFIDALQAEPNESTQPLRDSGFMLLSVGRVSKTRHEKQDPNFHHPVVNVTSKHLNDSSNTSLGDSVTFSSTPPNDDAFVQDVLYGSGSVEAEEFEDDTSSSAHDEDGDFESAQTVVGNVARFCNAASRLSLNIHSAPSVRNWISVNSHTERSGTATPHSVMASYRPGYVVSRGCSLPQSSLRPQFDHISSGGHLSSTQHYSPLAILTQRAHLPSGSYQSNCKSAQHISKILMVDVHTRQNISHLGSQIVSCLPPVNHTAPVSNHASPPYADSQTTHAQPNSVQQQVSVDGDNKVHLPVVLAEYDPTSETVHSSVICSCLHHLRSNTLSDSHPIVQIDTNRMLSDETALGATSLPPLQPASRFRKARIHETVEQWAYGRASVHDCHLRTVPDWVSDIQKKSGALKQQLVAALNHKVHCPSCLELVLLDHRPNNHRQIHSQTCPKSNSMIHPTSSDPLQLPQNGPFDSLVLLDSDIENSNFLSFWDRGLRVQPRIPRVDRSCICHNVAQPLVIQESNHGLDVCLVCSNCSNLRKDASSHNGLDTEQLRDHCSLTVHPSLSEKECSKTVSTSQSAVNHIGLNSTSSALSQCGLSSNITSSAAAYLRQGHNNAVQKTGIPSLCSETQIRQSRTLSVDVSHAAYEGSAKLPLNSVDMSLLSLSYSKVDKRPHLVIPSGNLVDIPNIPPRTLVRRPSKTIITGLVPPTSPTFMDLLDNQPEPMGTVTRGSPSTDPCVKGTFLNGVYPEKEHDIHTSSVPTECIYADSRSHVSGSYHNMPVWDHSPRMFDTSGVTRDRSLAKPLSTPTSLSNSFRSLFAHMQGTPVMEHMTNGDHHNGPDPIKDFNSLQTNQRFLDIRGPLDLQHTGSSDTVLSSGMLQQEKHDYHTHPVGLEERISKSMNVIRSAMENAFQHELATVHAENVRLSAEVERLVHEVSVLRGYQTAFYALRPFVLPAVWERLYEQQLQSIKRCTHGSLHHTTPSTTIVGQFPTRNQPDPS